MDSDYGPTAAAQTTLAGDWVFSGGVEKSTASVSARARAKASLGEPIRLSGYVRRAPRDVPVAIYCQEAGKPSPTKPTVTVTADRMDGLAMFAALLPGFKHNVLITAEVGALYEDELPGADQITVKVRARTRLAVAHDGGRLLLTARVTPVRHGRTRGVPAPCPRSLERRRQREARPRRRRRQDRRRCQGARALHRRVDERRERLDHGRGQVDRAGPGPGGSRAPALSRLRAAPVRQPC